MAVTIDERTVYAPDGAIICGPKLADETILLVNLSSSSKSCLRARLRSIMAAKLSGYFSLPSVQHYLILDPERRVAIHHKRGASDAIETRVFSEGAVKLDPPGFEVAVEALFPLP